MATKEDWVSVVEQEEGELLVIQLIDEVIHNSHQVLFKKHIDVQILPFAVDFAKNTILDLINYHFFSRDPGNNDNVLWIPDDEPEPIQTDSWACASVPVRTLGDHFVRTNPEGVIELLDPAVKMYKFIIALIF
ncbi:hypothetical protein BC833DRAFT_57099 [Globomyces pollinis-pini]|nr:hypothetical protein BC833DRAFT_57099 [Globomyces pollinis-pini]